MREKIDFKVFFEAKDNRIYTLVVALLFFLGVGIGYFGNINNETGSEVVSTETEEADGETITLLCLGIDKQVAMDERHPETNSIGQADGIFVVSIDTEADTVDIVAIPRDTIVMIEKYNSQLQYMGRENAQICLQYAYADGMERSCELMVDRVEELFPSVTIDGCVAINIEAITGINDAVGGVEVTVNDEYTALNMGIPVGSTITLTGDNAMLYLRLRDKSVEGSAYTRMERIKEYITAFIPKGIETIKKNPAIVTEMYETLNENMVTDLSVGDVAGLVPKLMDGALENVSIYTIQGETVLGIDGYEEFYPNNVHMRELESLLR